MNQPTSNLKAAKALHTRGLLLDAAELLVGEVGPEAVTLRDMKARAGQGNNSVVQYHFGSTEAFEAVMEALVARWAAEVADVFERPGRVTSLMSFLPASCVSAVARTLTSSEWRPVLTATPDWARAIEAVSSRKMKDLRKAEVAIIALFTMVAAGATAAEMDGIVRL